MPTRRPPRWSTPALPGGGGVAATKTRIGFDKFADHRKVRYAPSYPTRIDLKVRYAESYLRAPPDRLIDVADGQVEAALPGGTACRKNPT